MSHPHHDAASNGAGAATADAAPESLDRVRDILFGGQMRTVEARLQSLEERLQAEQDAMRQDYARRVADLEAFTRQALQELAERLSAERAKRAEDLQQLHVELREAIRVLERRHAKLEETTGMADAELRDQLMNHAISASAELARTAERLATEQQRSHRELAHAKTDRAALAGLLQDIATRLADDGAGTNGRLT